MIFLEQGEFKKSSAKKPHCFRNKKNLILELRARAESRLALKRRLRWPKELREAIRATFSQ